MKLHRGQTIALSVWRWAGFEDEELLALRASEREYLRQARQHGITEEALKLHRRLFVGLEQALQERAQS